MLAKVDDASAIALAKLAATLIAPGDMVMLCASEVCNLLADHIPQDLVATVATNSMSVMRTLVNTPRIALMATGGRVGHLTGALAGRHAVELIHGLRFDITFISADAIDPNYGFTTNDADLAELYRRLLECSRRLVLLADASAMGRVALHRVASIQQIHMIVAEAPNGPELRLELRRSGVRSLRCVTSEPANLSAEPTLSRSISRQGSSQRLCSGHSAF